LLPVIVTKKVIVTGNSNKTKIVTDN